MSNDFYECLLYGSPYWREGYSGVPDIILNKIYPATEWHDVCGLTRLEKDIFPTLQDILNFFPFVKNTIHLIVELQPQTSIKKEKERVYIHSSKRDTIIKKEGQKNKKESKPYFPTYDSKPSSNQKSNKRSRSTSEITVSESESSLLPAFRTHCKK